MNKKTIIIAEAGVNHNGNLDLAKKMIDMATTMGADIVKFQTAIPELVMTSNAPKAEYQRKTVRDNESQLEMAKRIHLPLSAYKILKKHADDSHIIFASTPYDLPSIKTLTKLNVPYIKIASAEITSFPYLKAIGKLRKKIILATGMATLNEISFAIKTLISSGTKKSDITLMQCNTDYPTDFSDVNLRAMISMRKHFGLNVGYSDHTLGIEIPIAAVALGAAMIEKHFTLDRSMPGPDHQVSLLPREFEAMVKAIRHVELSLGDGIKRPSSSEIKNKVVMRKSIVAAKVIKKGELFTEKNITIKRPAMGMSPLLWNKVIGLRAKRDFKRDEFIKI